MDQHNLSFFGQKTAVIVMSTSKSEPHVMVKCIKKKNNNEWEKPSQNEGKYVKFSLRELIQFHAVLIREMKEFSTFHKFKDQSTSIRIAWDEYDTNLLWINIGEYSRPISFPDTELLKRFLAHLIEEKIEFATGLLVPENAEENSNQGRKRYSQKRVSSRSYESPVSKAPRSYESSSPNPEKQEFTSQKPRSSKRYSSKKPEAEVLTIEGKIEQVREKALLLRMTDNTTKWFPRSLIQSDYDTENSGLQSFRVPSWVMS